jgi:hypothetical protein
MTNEQFAQHLGTGVRTVAKWNAQPELVPITELQRALDTMLSRSSMDVQERFASIVHSQAPPVPPQRQADHRAVSDAERRLAEDASVIKTLTWLDEHVGWPRGTAQDRVAKEIRRLESSTHHDRSSWGDAGRAAIANALTAFYRPTDGYLPYRANIEGELIGTSILTRPEWLDLGLLLGRGRDRSSLANDVADTSARLDRLSADAAARRVAQAVLTGGRLVNAPLYSLRRMDLTAGSLAASFGVADFLSYALTLDLLEGELVEAVAAGTSCALPLRERYLPDLAAITDIEHRLCAGGPLALFAAARAPRRGRPGGRDYMFLVQLRSPQTLNANGRLAVIPKAFHQPTVDYTEDAQLCATIEREMEEELFGRSDLDDTGNASRQADPLHPSRLSAPMRWLAENAEPKTWRIELTGFGLNMMSGNFEFASLIVIDDERWWDEYGGAIEVNWEAEGLRRFSTLDSAGVASLVHDDRWSNEALFALLQGLRRLIEIGGPRVELPPIALET